MQSVDDGVSAATDCAGKQVTISANKHQARIAFECMDDQDMFRVPDEVTQLQQFGTGTQTKQNKTQTKSLAHKQNKKLKTHVRVRPSKQPSCCGAASLTGMPR